MAVLTISGDAASRWEDVAQSAAQMLNFELVTETRLAQWMTEEFGASVIPARLWLPAAATVLARLAQEHHLAIAVEGSERLFPAMAQLVRARVAAPVAYRVGNLMLEERLERPRALVRLRELDALAKRLRKARSGRTALDPGEFDMTVNAAHPQAAGMLAAGVTRSLGAPELLGHAMEELQFKTRLALAKRGIVPAVRAQVKRVKFGHPSEEVFANLLDFYRIEWQHEPRTFALQWDKSGQVTKAFTPDFYLPEFDLYIELTTMKQSLVSHKNRKVAMLRAIYPHVNIQVFYQKDFQDLIFRHGLRMAG
jgi:hypothetical protein